jgi:hypothetical protein
MIHTLFFYAGMTLPSALIAFGVIWYRQRSNLTSSLGIGRLARLLALVWGTCFLFFMFMTVLTALSGVSNLSSFQGAYNILAGIAGYVVGTSLINRMLRERGSYN